MNEDNGHIKAICVDYRTHTYVHVPIDPVDGQPQEWIYLRDGQLAPYGERYHRRRTGPVVPGDAWEYYPG